ncbi:hypothetical protein, partial [Planococcus sp. S3-L1]|uniref:hypothetical protein n=1 Tax=Planococcus sp. S3-L1 TaxID=3046200 RepID=UPI0024B9EB7D
FFCTFIKEIVKTIIASIKKKTPIAMGMYINPLIILSGIVHDAAPEGLEKNMATDSPFTLSIKAKIPKQKKTKNNLNESQKLFFMFNSPYFFNYNFKKSSHTVF